MNWSWVKQSIYPIKCVVCQRIITEEIEREKGICWACEAGALVHYICPTCGKPYHMGEERCFSCKNERPKADKIMGIFPYKGAYRKSIARWKYGGRRKYAKVFAPYLANTLMTQVKEPVQALVPVPISKQRYKKRGFNQAYDLANELSKRMDIPVYDVLQRVVDSKPQSNCSKEERLQNIKGAFKVNKLVLNSTIKHIALIDDIYTTGATVNECIRCLKQGFECDIECVSIGVICITT